MDAAQLKNELSTTPSEAGVYLFYDSSDTILYVGKATNLSDRLQSYLTPRTPQIAKMVETAVRIEHVLTRTETQALLLEANLIAQHQPAYNIRLKGGSPYPLVQLTAHENPRLEITRTPDETATVFGPFTSKEPLETVVKGLREVYGVRSCSEEKYTGRDRPCLEYELGLCTAPCTGEITSEVYQENVRAVHAFFDGDRSVLTDSLHEELDNVVDSQNFERAAHIRDTLTAVQALSQEHTHSTHPQHTDTRVECLGVAIHGSDAVVYQLQSENGQLTGRETHTLEGDFTTSDRAAVLDAFAVQYYADQTPPDVLLLPVAFADTDIQQWLSGIGVDVRVPSSGRYQALVDLAMKNAQSRPESQNAVTELADRLELDSAERIEGFDVSHLQGTDVVGSNVVFDDGVSVTEAYRRTKLTDGNDDVGHMAELVRWRAERATGGTDDRIVPDMLLIDGGREQLAAAEDAVAEFEWEVPVVALAKEHERVFFDGDVHTWGSGDAWLNVLQRVRDEAHRFAVEYHRSRRDTVETRLDVVSGVGPATRSALLSRFGTVEAVVSAPDEELRGVPGVGVVTVRNLREAFPSES